MTNMKTIMAAPRVNGAVECSLLVNDYLTHTRLWFQFLELQKTAPSATEKERTASREKCLCSNKKENQKGPRELLIGRDSGRC